MYKTDRDRKFHGPLIIRQCHVSLLVHQDIAGDHIQIADRQRFVLERILILAEKAGKLLCHRKGLLRLGTDQLHQRPEPRCHLILFARLPQVNEDILQAAGILQVFQQQGVVIGFSLVDREGRSFKQLCQLFAQLPHPDDMLFSLRITGRFAHGPLPAFCAQDLSPDREPAAPVIGKAHILDLLLPLRVLFPVFKDHQVGIGKDRKQAAVRQRIEYRRLVEEHQPGAVKVPDILVKLAFSGQIVIRIDRKRQFIIRIRIQETAPRKAGFPKKIFQLGADKGPGRRFLLIVLQALEHVPGMVLFGTGKILEPQAVLDRYDQAAALFEAGFADPEEFSVGVFAPDIALRVLKHPDQGDDIKLFGQALLNVLEIPDHDGHVVHVAVPPGVDPASAQGKIHTGQRTALFCEGSGHRAAAGSDLEHLLIPCKRDAVYDVLPDMGEMIQDGPAFFPGDHPVQVLFPVLPGDLKKFFLHVTVGVKVFPAVISQVKDHGADGLLLFFHIIHIPFSIFPFSSAAQRRNSDQTHRPCSCP